MVYGQVITPTLQDRRCCICPSNAFRKRFFVNEGIHRPTITSWISMSWNEASWYRRSLYYNKTKGSCSFIYEAVTWLNAWEAQIKTLWSIHCEVSCMLRKTALSATFTAIKQKTPASLFGSECCECQKAAGFLTVVSQPPALRPEPCLRLGEENLRPPLSFDKTNQSDNLIIKVSSLQLYSTTPQRCFISY